MAHDPNLADRIRERIGAQPDVTEQRMFGGLAFLVAGNLAVAASGQGGLMVRADPAHEDELLATPHARPMEMRGRPLSGWLRVDPDGLGDEGALAAWVDRAVAYARSLPAKPGRPA
jgi:TfoX/Sxy family transcriptional regulator of competence genes